MQENPNDGRRSTREDYRRGHIMYKLNKYKVALVFLFCILGASIVPLQEFSNNGSISGPTLIISFIALLLGAVTALCVVLIMRKKGSFFHRKLGDRK